MTPPRKFYCYWDKRDIYKVPPPTAFIPLSGVCHGSLPTPQKVLESPIDNLTHIRYLSPRPIDDCKGNSKYLMTAPPAKDEIKFIQKHIQRLLNHYTLSYCRKDNYTEYFITNKQTNRRISYALKLSYYHPTNRLHVAKFCPMLSQQPDSKYLSAACFYLLIHHFIQTYQLGGIYGVSLKTDKKTFETFYARLKGFNFHIHKQGLGKIVEIHSDYMPVSVDTSRVAKLLFA